MQGKVVYIFVKYEVESLTRCVPWEMVIFLNGTYELKLCVIYRSKTIFADVIKSKIYVIKQI